MACGTYCSHSVSQKKCLSRCDGYPRAASGVHTLLIYPRWNADELLHAVRRVSPCTVLSFHCLSQDYCCCPIVSSFWMPLMTARGEVELLPTAPASQLEVRPREHQSNQSVGEGSSVSIQIFLLCLCAKGICKMRDASHKHRVGNSFSKHPHYF